jgi:hypothetical protein
VTARKFQLVFAALGGALTLLQLLGLYLQTAGDYDGAIAAALGQGALYLAAVFCLTRNGANVRGLLWLILAVAVILRVATVEFPPYLSSDIYRYVWDGEVQGAGINPYRYVPADDNLKELRDSAIYPSVNRANYARTIYPPAAQFIFLGVTRISATVLAMKIAMLAFDLATIFLLLRLLKELRAPPSHIAIYAWHPLAIWEIAGSGHVDAAAAAFVTVALLACYRRAPFIAGLFLASAALVKFLPIAIVPALYRRWDWRLPAAFAATAICFYLPYLSVGREVLGFLPAYVSEERLATGGGYFIVSLISFVSGWTLPAVAYLAAALLLLAALAVLAMRDAAKGDWARQLGWCLSLATTLLILLTPHYPWYFLWLLPLLCLAPRWPVLILTTGSFVLYAVLENRSGARELVFNSVLYGSFLLATAGQLWVHRRERRSAAAEETAGSGR